LAKSLKLWRSLAKGENPAKPMKLPLLYIRNKASKDTKAYVGPWQTVLTNTRAIDDIKHT
jgi:hypothetical protein